jgi:multicomponent Na+:H+ antiporter subunit D
VLLIVVAMLTMVIGILGAVAQAGIRRMLSFTLVSHIGYMIFGIALGTEAGWAATVYYIAHHILVQTALFLVTGLIERIAGTATLTHLAGMLQRSPFVAVIFFVPMLNLGGIPPFSGFIGKLGLFIAGAEGTALEVPQWLVWTGIGVGALTSLLTLYALIRVWNLGFWRSQDEVAGFDSQLMTKLEEIPGGDVVSESKANSIVMNTATAVMVGVTICMTVFAGQIYEFADAAAANLTIPAAYVDGVSGTEGIKP